MSEPTGTADDFLSEEFVAGAKAWLASQPPKIIRTGDTVFHKPSGETWMVAWADTRELIACGWPETFAKVSDCMLLISCSDEEHWKLVEQIAGKIRQDSRSNRCWYLLEQRREAECFAMLHL